MVRVSCVRMSAAFLLLAVLSAAPSGASTVELLSRIPPQLASETAGGRSQAVSLSADGRFLLFLSNAPNLIQGVTDSNGGDDVFLYDRATGETELVSRSAGAESATADRGSREASMSADGRFVVFTSGADDLVLGPDNAVGQENVFLWDRVSGAMELVSHIPRVRTREGSGLSFQPSISADGRYVAFVSFAPDLVDDIEEPSTTYADVFLFDRRTGRISLVSHSAASPQAAPNRGSSRPVLSADGRFVAFLSEATNLVPGQVERNHGSDVFLWERTTGRITLVSHAAGDPVRTTDGLGEERPFLSADGSFVAFLSRGSNLVRGQSGTALNVFLWTRANGEITLVTHAPTSPVQSAGAFSSIAGLSADGNWLLFSSTGRRLVRGQREQGVRTNYDAFLWSRQTGQIRLVSGSEGSATRTANGPSFAGSLSADGAWVVLASQATDLAADGDDSGFHQDVFLWSRSTGRASFVSHAAGSSEEGGGDSTAPVISGDGRFLAYASNAPDLDAEVRDTNDSADVILESRTGTREIVTLHAPGLAAATPQGQSLATSIDASGRWVTFLSNAPELLPGQVDPNNGNDVFLYDRATGAKTLVSHAAGALLTAGDGACTHAWLNADGRFVAFLCRARNLVPGQAGPPGAQLFLWSRETGVTMLVSHAAGAPETAANAETTEAVISADGSVVAFASSASDLIAGQIDPFTAPDVFVWERATGTVTLLSGKAGSPTEAGNNSSFTLRMSGDGRIVAFASLASDLVADATDTNDRTDVFIHDRTTGRTALVTRSTDGPEAVGGEFPLLSADGRFLAFASLFFAVPGQTGPSAVYNLFLADLETGTKRLVSHTPEGPTVAAGGLAPDLDMDATGRFLAFVSSSHEVVSGQQDAATADVFLFDRESGVTTLVSRAHGTAATTANGESGGVQLSADGRYLVFGSEATNLTVEPTSGPRGRNLFLYDRTTGGTSLVTHSLLSPSRGSNGFTLAHVLAASGSAVAFSSSANDLVTRDFNNQADAFAAPLP